MNKKFVIFIDWYGTLNSDLFWSGLLPRPEMKVAKQKLIGPDTDIFNDWMRGKYTSEEINCLMAEWSGLPYELLWKEFVASCQVMSVDESVKEIIQELRLSAYVVLATCNMDCFNKFTVPALKLEEVFDKIIVSFDLGFLKTEKDGEFFLSTLHEINIPIERSFLIDDSKSLCDFFTALGGRAYQINNKDEVTAALENIRQFVKLNP